MHSVESNESVKCASVNGKLEAEVISMCCPNLGWSQEFNKDV